MKETLEYIDAYFQQALNEDEKKEFERMCEQDRSFAEEVAFYITSRQAIREKLLLQKQALWKEESVAEEIVPFAAPVRKMFLRKWLPYAVAACLILAIAIYFFEGSPNPRQLAISYINKNYIHLSQTMDGGRDSLQMGLEAYNIKEYDKALQLFEAIQKAHPDNSDAKKYAGYLYLVKGDYDNALQQFDSLAGMKGLFTNPGVFLKAETLLMRGKEGDKDEAKQLLQQVVNEKLENSKEAAEWLKKF